MKRVRASGCNVAPGTSDQRGRCCQSRSTAARFLKAVGTPACDDTESDSENELTESDIAATRKRFKCPSLEKRADARLLEQHFVYSLPGSAGSLSDEEQNSPVKIGDVLGGRWNLKERLGTGSFGKVFLASDAYCDGEAPVAVKVLRTSRSVSLIVCCKFTDTCSSEKTSKKQAQTS